MTRIRVVVMAMMAVFAVGAVASASASAKEGFFKDGTAEPATGHKFKGKLLSATAVLQAKGHSAVTCTGATGTGEVLSVSTAEGTITFTGCEGFGKKCKTSGSAAGEIVAKELSLLPVLEKTSTGTFEPALRTKILKEVVFECGSAETEVKVTGDFLALIPSEAGTEKGWLGTEEKGLLFHVTAKQTAGVQEGTFEYRESETGATKTASLLTSAEGSLEKFTGAQSGEGAELSLEFTEAVSIFA
jgi:hypothetical protein